jgi:hypothetical protein
MYQPVTPFAELALALSVKEVPTVAPHVGEETLTETCADAKAKGMRMSRPSTKIVRKRC